MEMSVRLNKNWGWFVGFGIALIALGIFAIGAAALTTLISVVFLGVLLIIGGVVMLIDTFKAWSGSVGSFILFFLFSLFYLIAGILLIKHPVSAAVSITLLLAIFYMVVGVFRILGSLAMRLPHWGWGLFSGIIALALGILIMAHWPASSLFIIGLFVGIDLVFNGWTYVILGLAARRPVAV